MTFLKYVLSLEMKKMSSGLYSKNNKLAKYIGDYIMRDNNYTPEKLINDVLRNFIGLENLLETATRTVNFPKMKYLKTKIQKNNY